MDVDFILATFVCSVAENAGISTMLVGVLIRAGQSSAYRHASMEVDFTLAPCVYSADEGALLVGVLMKDRDI